MGEKDEKQNDRLTELEKAEAVREHEAKEVGQAKEFKLARLKTYAIVATAVFTLLAVLATLFLYVLKP